MQELAIILAILIGAIWLLVKIFKGISVTVEAVSKDIDEAVARWKKHRYEKGRGRLRQYVNVLIPNELDTFEKEFEATQRELKQAKTHRWTPTAPEWTKEIFQPVAPVCKRGEYSEMCVDDIGAILSPSPDRSTWWYKEFEIIKRHCKYPSEPPRGNFDNFTAFPTLSSDLKMAALDVNASHVRQKEVTRYFSDEQMSVQTYNNRRTDLIAETASLNSEIEQWNKQSQASWESYVAESKEMGKTELLAFLDASDLYTKACTEERTYFVRLLEGYKKGEKQSVVERLNYVLDKIKLPASVPHTWDNYFDEEQRIAIVEIGLPDVVHQPPFKTVTLKSGTVKKPLNQTERKELVPKIHPAILLRTAYEVFRNDTGKTIDLLVLNGWVTFDDPATGVNTKAYTASLMVARDQITPLNLAKIDPLAAFDNLHGKSAGKLIEIIPIEPMLSLNRKDSRFVDAKEILSGLDRKQISQQWTGRILST